jgi:hypothetical protein
MEEKLRVMSERPLNAETPAEYLRSWITANAVFFARKQGPDPGAAHSARAVGASSWSPSGISVGSGAW